VPLVADIRFAFRTLVKNPGFTAAAVVMLALGIGLNAAVFTVTDAVLFKGFHFVKRNDRLVYISNNGNCCVSYPDFETYRAEAKSFQGMAIVHGVARVLTDKSGFPERYDATEVSADTFRVVGQRPILGRDFTPADEAPGAAATAILSYSFWENRFGKDPAILGRTVRMSDTPTTMIGIMPRGFSFPQKVDVWFPW
jgi:putative ABC transport system permease protein